MSGSTDSFDSLKKYKRNDRTTRRQNHAIIGHASINFTLSYRTIKSIFNILYVPRLKKNLLSIDSIIKIGFITCFDKKKYILYTKGSKNIIVKGKKNPKNGFY